MNYCPTCGIKLKEKPIGTGAWAQMGIYALSIALPPLNIPLTFKYLRASEAKAKIIGWISLVLMTASLIVATVLAINTIGEVNRQVEGALNMYQGY